MERTINKYNEWKRIRTAKKTLMEFGTYKYYEKFGQIRLKGFVDDIRKVSIPYEIFSLTDAVDLDLYDNGLKELPKEIKYMKELEVLDLSFNDLTTLPEEIKELSNSLKHIFLRENQISSKELKRIKQMLPNTKFDISYEETDQEKEGYYKTKLKKKLRKSKI